MRMTLKVTDTATKNLKIAPFKLWRGMDAGIKEAMEKTKRKMRSNVAARLHSRTGTAVKAIETRGPWGFRGKKILGRVGAFHASKSKPSYRAADYYLKAHEYGTTIRPKKGAYLAIPQPDGTIRRVRSVTLPARSWFRSSLQKQTILGMVIKHIRRSLRFK